MARGALAASRSLVCRIVSAMSCLSPCTSQHDVRSSGLFMPLANGGMLASSFLSPELNAGGALDVIVIRHDDGSLRATDFFVVFESLDAPATVAVTINGEAWDMGPDTLHATAAFEPACFGEGASPTPPTRLLSLLGASLLLRNGRNELCYSVGGGARARLCVRAFLYVWHAALPAVVFDVDGTITQSDIAGQLANIIDGSPTHDGVCEMLCNLHARGYLIMYLTSRPLLGPSGIERTRRFLFQVAVDNGSGYRMPPAAVVTTRHVSTWSALTSELSGGSKAFKSSVLQRVRDIFRTEALCGGDSSGDSSGGSGCGSHGRDGSHGSSSSGQQRPGGLYAGFGNREKDALAYLSAGVPPERIFIIDTSSRIVGRAALISTADGSCSSSSGSLEGGEDGPAAAAAASAAPAAAASCGAVQRAAQPTWQSYRGMIQSIMEPMFPALCPHTALSERLAQFATLAMGTQEEREKEGSLPLW